MIFPATLPRPFARWRTALFIGLVCLLAAIVFHPVRHFEFLNFDDDLYLQNNPWLKQGLTWESAKWALTANLFTFSMRAEYWSPLTLFTRLFDAEVHGLNAGPHHVTSAVLHVLNTLALFLALRSLTGAWWRPAIVALVFLLHPLNVEPVAWLSARKDLVSAFFFFLTLAAYGHYARSPSRKRYALVALAFCAGAMSKPMVVTIPALLLVLDFWPLGRWAAARNDRAQQLRIVAEKLPLFVVAGVVGFVAVLGQKDWGALQSTENFPLPVRIGNAVLSYATFLRRIVWPDDLAIYYPHAGASLSWALVAGAAALILALTIFAVGTARGVAQNGQQANEDGSASRPYLGFVVAGWLWFLGVLVPVIGFVQIGNQAMADRYAYPAAIGIFVAVVWGCAELLRSRPKIAAVAVAAVVSALAWASAKQLTHWRDSEAAFTRAIAVTEKNDVAYLNLGSTYFVKGDLPRAREDFTKSLELRPLQANGWNNLGAVEAALGRVDPAIHCYTVALRINPRAAKSHFHLGKLLLQRGETQPAEVCFRRANELEPGWAEPYAELGTLLRARGEQAEAEHLFAAHRALTRR